jgi:TolB-like protein
LFDLPDCLPESRAAAGPAPVRDLVQPWEWGLFFHFKNCSLDTNRRELHRAGESVAVEPQVFDLLVYLIENRDRVVSKDDLIAGIWGGRAISDSTVTSRINAARTAIGDDGKTQSLLRTIPRKGFRFVGEVDEARDANHQAQDQTEADPLPPLITDRPSIAVLPFENLSDDKRLELLANGLAEDIIALLARVPGFFVIARASSFAYVQRPTEIHGIGAELGVRYIVTGSARSSATRVRISVQLVESESGNQLWAGRYDVERGDTLDLQDEIARQIIVELEPALTKAEFSSVRRRRTDSIDAWTHFRQAAGAVAVHGWNEESVVSGLAELRQAIAIDPDFALAHALLALVSAFGANLSLVADIETVKQEAHDQAEHAVAIDPNASDVLGLAGCALADVGNLERGRALLLRALELDPSNAQAHVAFGIVETRLGRFDEGIASLKFGMRSSPKDFRLTFWNMLLADALCRAKYHEEALNVASQAARRDGRLYGAHVISAWALSRLNRPDEARIALADARRVRPTLSLEEIARFFGQAAAADLSSMWN